MKLKKLVYHEFLGTVDEWHLKGCTFDHVNLIVGKNATGKTKMLNVIRNLATLLADNPKLQWSEGFYTVEFSDDKKSWDYHLEYSNQRIKEECVRINSEVYLERVATGEGIIKFEEIGQKMRFQTSPDEVAALARRDAIQHPFLEDLYNWGKNLFRYDFGTLLGHDTYWMPAENPKGGKLDTKSDSDEQPNIEKDQARVVLTLHRGIEKYGPKFEAQLLEDMDRLGYKIDEIGIEAPRGIRLDRRLPEPLVGIYVKESDRDATTAQYQISQGMFRALSLLIQTNYLLSATKSSCILIDDIGEGLDYERATSLVELMMHKAKQHGSQLIMTTNDRFIMNAVPLECWTILQREGGQIRAYNYRNAQNIFDEFRLTGLSNFDLFSSQFYLKNQNDK